MVFDEMVAMFNEMFPIVEKHVEKYIPYEKDSIIIETEDGNRLKFKPTNDGFELTKIN